MSQPAGKFLKMNDGGYDAFDDSYAYEGTDVLRNKAGNDDTAV